MRDAHLISRFAPRLIPSTYSGHEAPAMDRRTLPAPARRVLVVRHAGRSADAIVTVGQRSDHDDGTGERRGFYGRDEPVHAHDGARDDRRRCPR